MNVVINWTLMVKKVRVKEMYTACKWFLKIEMEYV